MRNSFILTVLILLIRFSAFAQYPKEFPADNAGYAKSFSDFIKANCSRDDCKELAEKFPKVITAGKASTYFPKIKNITQALLMRKAPAYPVMFNFATMLGNLETAKASTAAIDKNFDILQAIADRSKGGNLKEFDTYVNFLNNLYIKNTLYASNTNNWYASGDYSVDIKDDKPVYSFLSTDLMGISTADTINIKGESGKYYPLENLWIGNKGNISLQRAGFDPANNFLNFGNHQINFSKTDIVIDSAKFTFKPVLNEVLLGTYLDKLLQAKSQERVYPKFTSYKKDVNFNTLSKEIGLVGGFQLEGTNIYVVGSDTSQPVVTLKNKENKEVVKATCKRIAIKDFKDLSLTDASLAILLKDNTITHNYLNINYSSKTKNLMAYRDMKPLSKQPFTSDYHQMFIYADELSWNIDSLTMKFGMATLSGEKPAIFESYNYYQQNIENKYKGSDEQGPISRIYAFYAVANERKLDAQSVAFDISPNAPYNAVQPTFVKLMEDGYIKYDASTRTIEVKDKLINQALSAKGKQDYDFIKFASFKKYGNAKLDIKSNILEVYGVDEINMSSKSGVKFIPSTDTVKIGKNRTMTMGGRIIAGKFDFLAKKVDFDYENYAFNMNKIDSMVVYVPNDKPNEKGQYVLSPSRSPIQNISGTLHIAEPENKSGTSNNLKYPFFSSGDTSKVTYDRGANGDKYNKDKFYYQIYPFEIDSLNDVLTENLDFKGRLISGGIFNPIESGLTLQDDKSFGLQIETPKGGYDLFGNKGKYFSDLKLNADGLSGKGLFEFGSIKMYSDTSFFFMDSVYAKLDSIRITQDKKANKPEGKINASSFVWNQKIDSLVVSPAKDEKFTFYDNVVDLNGKMILYKKDLLGKGLLSIGKTKLESDEIAFGATQFSAKNAKLNLVTEEGNSLLASDAVNALYDLDKKIADVELIKNDTIPLASFKYVSNPKNLHFDLAKNMLTLNAASASAKFFLLSTDPTKDSLKFVTNTAELNLNDNSIHFAGINELLLADSKVIPDKGEIFIEQDGTVRKLKNAIVIFNRDSSYHTVKDAEINVVGRNDFSGTGNYYYKNGASSTKVSMAEIGVNNPYKGQVIPEGKKGKKTLSDRDYSKVFTYANTIIEEAANFKLDNKVFYKGNFNFDSKHKNIFLDGDIKIEIAGTSSDWIPNKQELDPNKPAINLESVLKDNNNIFVGLLLDKTNIEFYQAILQDKHSPGDAAIMNVRSTMSNSKTEPNTMLFGDESALTKYYSHASCIKYNETSKQMDANGEIGLGLDLYPCAVTTAGSFTFSPSKPTELTLAADMALKFKMNPVISNQLINAYLNAETDVTFANSYKRNKTVQRTMSVLTKDSLEANQLLAGMYTTDSFFIPKSFDYNLLLSGTQFFWDAQDASFKSVGNVSLAIFGNDIIKRTYNAYVEIGYAYESDFVNIYLESKSGNWLFMKVKKGQMGIASSAPEVMNTLAALKSSDKVFRENKLTIFEFMPADLMMRDNFVIRMEDFKERFKSKIPVSAPLKTPSAPVQQEQPNNIEQPTPVTPSDSSEVIKNNTLTPEQPTPPKEQKDEFKQKPKKAFPLSQPAPTPKKEEQPESETPATEVNPEAVPETPAPAQDSTTTVPTPKKTTKSKTKPK